MLPDAYLFHLATYYPNNGGKLQKHDKEIMAVLFTVYYFSSQSSIH